MPAARCGAAADPRLRARPFPRRGAARVRTLARLISLPQGRVPGRVGQEDAHECRRGRAPGRARAPARRRAGPDRRGLRAAGRDPGEVELLAVTKTVPAADVATLLDLGLTAFGENRVQEAGAKVAEVAALRPDAAPRWHLVGTPAAEQGRGRWRRWADRVESVDSVRLADALDAGARRRSTAVARAGRLPVLLQFSVDGDPRARRRARRRAAPRSPSTSPACAGLQLAGLMAVAPLGVDPERAFADVAAAAARLRAEHSRRPRRSRPE